MFGQVFGNEVPDFAGGYACAMCGTGARGQRRHGYCGECQQGGNGCRADLLWQRIAVLYIVSSLRRLQWLLRQTKNWRGKRFFQIEYFS